MPQRVVITGIGWVTPLGHDIETVWRRLLAGDCGVDRIARFDASSFPTNFAAQVKGYDHQPLMRFPELHSDVSPNTSFALGAGAQAWRSAGLDRFAELDEERLGVYLGAGEGVPDTDPFIRANLDGWDPAAGKVDAGKWLATALARMSSIVQLEQEPNMPLTHLALEFGVRGPAYNCLTACAASTQAIGEATHIIRRGDADVMLAGGAHTMIHPFGVTGFNRLTALSRRNDSPLTASRPFSIDRDGFVLGEGAGMLVLESLEHAERRGAKILAEITGYGSSADAYRVTDIHEDGRGAIASMQQALSDARMEPGAVDYIAAHGTGTKENDSIETKALKTVFGAGTKTPVSSVKSMLGHLIAAAGAVQLIACVLALRDQRLPPTINLHSPDPDCDLDYIPNASRSANVQVCLSNSFGFGGQNDTLIVRQPGR